MIKLIDFEHSGLDSILKLSFDFKHHHPDFGTTLDAALGLPQLETTTFKTLSYHNIYRHFHVINFTGTFMLISLHTLSCHSVYRHFHVIKFTDTLKLLTVDLGEIRGIVVGGN